MATDEFRGSQVEPTASRWVIEMWWRSVLRDSGPERPIYWHGPSDPYGASTLRDAAEFVTESEAASTFENLVVRLPRGASRWAAVTVETAGARPDPALAGICWGSASRAAT